MLACALLVVAAPLILFAAGLILVTSRGPILYRQTRVGLGGLEFELLKLRSMVRDAEAGTGPVWAADHDPRVTRIGRVLRKSHIDELPQLVNVLRHEMSLVGPRPERPAFVTELETSVPFYSLRKSVLPGITGLAQIRCGYGASREAAARKLDHDLAYVRNASVSFDMLILVRTVSVVLTGTGAR